jgi:protein-L-isoaspartate(D-aspartate) O-methyltransferase
LELLKDHLKPGSKVLDVGSGSGYLVACLSNMVGNQGKVIGIEYVKELADRSKERLKAEIDPTVKEMLSNGKIQIINGDGWMGSPENGPYDAIHVGAAAATLPQNLVNQLALNGRLIIPVGTYNQQLKIVDKNSNGEVTETPYLDVRYVPLVNPNKIL